MKTEVAEDKDEEEQQTKMRNRMKLHPVYAVTLQTLRLEVESLKMIVRPCACIPPEKHIKHNKSVVLSIPLAAWRAKRDIVLFIGSIYSLQSRDFVDQKSSTFSGLLGCTQHMSRFCYLDVAGQHRTQCGGGR